MNDPATCKYCGAKIDEFDPSANDLDIFEEDLDSQGFPRICDDCKLSVLENKIDVMRSHGEGDHLHWRVILITIAILSVIAIILAIAAD